MAPRWGQDGEQIGDKGKMQQKEGGMPRGPPVILAENGANAIPTWFPNFSQDGQKKNKRCLLGSICAWILIFLGP